MDEEAGPTTADSFNTLKHTDFSVTVERAALSLEFDVSSLSAPPWLKCQGKGYANGIDG